MAKKQIPDAEEFVLTGNFVCVNKRQGHENSTKHKHHTNTQLTNLETLRYYTLSTFTFQSLDAGTQFSTKTIQAVKKKGDSWTKKRPLGGNGGSPSQTLPPKHTEAFSSNNSAEHSAVKVLLCQQLGFFRMSYSGNVYFVAVPGKLGVSRAVQPG